MTADPESLRLDRATVSARACRLGITERLGLAADVRALSGALAQTLADESTLRQARAHLAEAAALLTSVTCEPGATRRLDGPLSGIGVLSELGPFTSPLHPSAPLFEIITDNEQVVATARYGPAHEGGPGVVHGGFIAAAFDELLGAAQRGSLRVTGRLAISFRAPALLEQHLCYRTWVEWIEGRKALVRGTLHDEQRLCAEAEALFIAPASPPPAELR